MKITRKFTKDGQDPFSTVEWTKRTSRISNPDGSVVFEMTDAETPKSWSQLATDIMVSKYFRKAGVPQVDADGKVQKRDGKVVTGPERSARQVILRLAGCWRYWGERHGYFDSPEDAQAFQDELTYMMVHQMSAPNSPQWFNTGLNWAYGITGPAQGHFVADPESGEVELAEDAYTHPQPHACFIQSIDDDLVNPGGIMDLWTREARLFKYGSGTGTNFSRLRGEGAPLSGGGKSSGLMSWLKIGDRAAAAIKSGGTTRRAAKMVCLDMDHPAIGRFVDWKVREELKVQALVEGHRMLMDKSKDFASSAQTLELDLSYDFNGEAYSTVAGQNSNNSVRIPDSFFEAVDGGDEWMTYRRTAGAEATAFDARELWDRIGYAAWRCADPGVQYDSTINAWHTCPSAGRINASNPCSEYMFLDNTACNLASLNVLKFYDREARTFDVERFEHAIDLWTMVLESSVLMAAFPSEAIAELSWKYRTLGLGYANLGAMLMQAGIPYDSDEGRSVCANLTGILTGRSYRMSAMLAGEHGAFAGYEDDKQNMLRVMRNHRRAAHGVQRDASEWEDLKIRPVPIDHGIVRDGRVGLANAEVLLERAVRAWDDTVAYGEEHGFRNAQTTVLAPTGTIGLLMDCDTTGVEPDFALVKFKKLAGGGYFKIVNASVEPALRSLGYSETQRKGIIDFIIGTLTLDTPMPSGVKGVKKGETLASWLKGKGLTDGDLAKISEGLPGVFELGFAFSAWGLGDDVLARLGLDVEKAKADPAFNALSALGLKAKHLAELNAVICGSQTIEGAPHMKDEHLPVFDCANTCGPTGKRFIAPGGHIRMMAAAQPFISGAISKTINLPNDASVEDIQSAYRLSWELGLKANALYRDGCKLSQPLSTKSSDGETLLDEADLEVDELGEAEAMEEVAASVTETAQAVAEARVDRAAEVKRELARRPMRRRLPDPRRSLTHKVNVAGHEGYLTVGLYEDGLPGELFITLAKEGSTIGGLMDSLGTATSVALQYGVPVRSLVNKFTHQRFEPAGMTGNPEIPIAKSLVDYIFRWLGIQFIEGYREANTPQRGAPATPAAPAAPARPAESGRVSSTSDAGPRLKLRYDTEERSSTQRVSVGDPKAEDSDRIEVDMSVQSSTLSVAMDNMGDAPPCDVCGTITVRSGTCYKCLNCGASMGCS